MKWFSLIKTLFSDCSVRSLVSVKRSVNHWVQTKNWLHFLADLWSQSEFRIQQKTNPKSEMTECVTEYIYCSRNCSTTWVTTRCSPALQCFLCGRSNIHYEKNTEIITSWSVQDWQTSPPWYIFGSAGGTPGAITNKCETVSGRDLHTSAKSQQFQRRCIQNGQTDSRHIISPHYHREGSSPWRTRSTHTACSNLRWRREIQWMWRRPDQMRTRRHDSSTCFIHAVTIENFWVSIQMISYSITN